MPTPPEILNLALQRAAANIKTPAVNNPAISDRVEFIANNIQNRAGVRLLMACLLAKIHNPKVDIRKPYTEIGTADSFSGRTYDEAHISDFINSNDLPCNPTTAFLTPALRNRNATLTAELNLVGRPPALYQSVLQLLDDVFTNKVTADDLLTETLRKLVIARDEKRQRMESLIKELNTAKGEIPLATETTVGIVEQHLKSEGASRLPVLVVAAAYKAAEANLGEKVLPMKSHNAADEQTGAVGDLEITLATDEAIVTAYEMKLKKVIRADIERALQKINASKIRVDNYIFITTDTIDPDLAKFAATLYKQTGGIEFVILDCTSFLRHFLHLFHRLRAKFLEEYQQLVINEPDSAVSQPLKEVLINLILAAELAAQRESTKSPD
jgi:DNA adenine methylase